MLRTAPVPLMMLSGLVRSSGYKVVLTGEGADEVFGGYDLFKEAKIRRFWARQPQSKWRPALLERLYRYLKHSPVGNAAVRAAVLRRRACTDLDNPASAHGRAGPRRAASGILLPADRARRWRDATWKPRMLATLPREFASWDGLARDQYLEAKTLLSGYLLSRRATASRWRTPSKAACPSSTTALIEFANALPAELQAARPEEKACCAPAAPTAAGGHHPPHQATVPRARQPEFLRRRRAAAIRDGAADARSAQARRLLRSRRWCSAWWRSAAQGAPSASPTTMAFVGILSTMLVHDMFVEGRGRNFDIAPAAEEGVRIESVQ